MSDPVVLSFHESLLRLSDIEILQGPHWLNDQIISFYFEYLEKMKYKSVKELLFISPEVTQCIKIIDESEINVFLSPLEAHKKPFIFFALNDNDSGERAGGSHWSLLVFSRPERAFFHFDSSGNSNLFHCQNFFSKIKFAIDCPNSILKSVKCLQQSNSYDCGIHVLCMADQIADHINRYESVEGVGPLNHDIISGKRNDILKIIVQLGGNIS